MKGSVFAGYLRDIETLLEAGLLTKKEAARAVRRLYSRLPRA